GRSGRGRTKDQSPDFEVLVSLERTYGNAGPFTTFSADGAANRRQVGLWRTGGTRRQDGRAGGECGFRLRRRLRKEPGKAGRGRRWWRRISRYSSGLHRNRPGRNAVRPDPREDESSGRAAGRNRSGD